MEIDGDDVSRLVQVRFTTKLKPPYKAPKASLAVPGSLTRRGLSVVVNDLLKSQDDDWKAEPFDFLIDGELVRLSLEEFLLAKNISVEKVLEIEYIKAAVPRKQEDPLLHDDWVSAVDASCPEFILTGCYDGFGRLWKDAQCSHVLEGHNGAITSISIINSKGEGDVTVATGSKDRTLRLWKIYTEKDTDQSTQIRAFKVLRGHRGAVQSIATKPSGDMVCSGSWDCTINIWETDEMKSASDAVSTKKRKGNSKVEESQLEGGATSTLVGHTQCVSSVVWKQPDTIYSASWDHSVRRWDVETGKDTWDMMSGGTPVAGGLMRQRHSQGYASSGDDLEDDACSKHAATFFAPAQKERTWVEVVENVLWIASAAFIIYYGDAHSNFVYVLWHDGRIRRLAYT